ncbi:peptidase S8 [Kitasatospora sp. NPDC052896]|uniref:peptidase S8 n=1 Tax=Kitasatospora sp. NPDC052896 TaxID=3364061 RepID=UPI0037CBCCC3
MRLATFTPTSATSRRIAIALAGTASLALSAFAAAPADAAPLTSSHDGSSWVRSCAVPTAGQMACDALRVTSVVQHVSPLGISANATPSGYGPSDLRSAYNLPANGGAGQTVAIVDAYNDPSAASDLAVYRAQYGLPACTTANGCFKQVSQTGSTTSLPTNNSGWAGEISLDLDMVSAIAPNAHIILVEAKSATTANLGTAVNEAVKLGAKFVSNSYGGSESSSDPSYDTSYYNHPGVAITASSGDGGYGVEYPAASRYVTAVGGTSLNKASNSRGWSESAWSTSSTEGAGSGCSAYDAKPTWQKDTGCSKRTVADVSAVADPATGVAVYQTYGGSGWNVYGGTSVASPIIAAVYADAGAPSASYPAADAYAHPSALWDVTTGSTATCSPSYLCTAGPGYDGPTGLGTPDGLAAFTG